MNANPSYNSYYVPTATVENISIYIPKVFGNISKERMIAIFELLYIGMVNHIDFVPKVGANGKPYNSAYVHFDFWYSNISNQNLQERLKNSIETRIVYDDPWYWIVLENKATKKDYSIPKPKINLDGLKEKLFLPRVLTNEGKTFVLKKIKLTREDREDFREHMREERCIAREERDY